jgi:flagellar biosynthesis component FlhA
MQQEHSKFLLLSIFEPRRRRLSFSLFCKSPKKHSASSSRGRRKSILLPLLASFSPSPPFLLAPAARVTLTVTHRRGEEKADRERKRERERERASERNRQSEEEEAVVTIVAFVSISSFQKTTLCSSGSLSRKGKKKKLPQ